MINKIIIMYWELNLNILHVAFLLGFLMSDMRKKSKIELSADERIR